MPIIEAVFLVSLIAPPSPELEQWVKTIGSITIPLLLLSGAMFLAVWKVFRSGKEAWTTLAVEFLLTETFDDSVQAIVKTYCLGEEFKRQVNETRKDAEWRFKELMRTMVEAHDADKNPHAEWRHNGLTTIVTKLEARLWRLETGQAAEKER